ncbi:MULTISPECIES: hypothetical protein [Sorangium]|nr:hypothetical protein [Sorangium cellulosum]
MVQKKEVTLQGNYEDFGGCMVGPPWGIDFSSLSPNELKAGFDHRIVVSARSGSWSSFPMRKFKIQTMWEPPIRSVERERGAGRDGAPHTLSTTPLALSPVASAIACT